MKTKIKKIILVWLFLMAILPILGQKRDQVISDQEVKMRYKLGVDFMELMKYDTFNNIYFIRKSEKLHALQKILLPASVWGIFYREKDAEKNDLYKYDRNHPRAFPKDAECTLCWLGLRDGLNQDESAIRKKLSNIKR